MNITNVKDILNRKLSGANIDDIQGISDYSLFKEAASNLLAQIDPAETVRRSPFNVFGTVYDYSPPSDFKEVMDIAKQAQRTEADNPTRRYREDFDQHKNENDFTSEWIDGSRRLRYSKDVGNVISVHTLDSVTSNGTWDGTAANIVASTFNAYQGAASIQADFDTGEYIENDDFTKVDLSDHENLSTLFFPFYCPDTTAAGVVTNIILRWGSSTSAYFSKTTSAPQFGLFRAGWNLVPFDWSAATETGTVDTDNIDYLRATLTLSASDTGYKFDEIFSALPEVTDLYYYSKYLFRSTAGTWLETPTADTDIICLDTNTENLFVYECIRLAALQIQGKTDVYNSYTTELYGNDRQVGLYGRYKFRNPDETIRPQQQYRRIQWTKK